jgi:3-oxoadipate enol-lactonase
LETNNLLHLPGQIERHNFNISKYKHKTELFLSTSYFQAIVKIMTVSVSSKSGYVQVSETPDVLLFYTIEGPLDGSKPVMVLSSSLAANTHLWDEMVPSFKADYTVLRYDARFHGQSPLSSSTSFEYATGHTMEDLTDDVLKILNHLEIKCVKAFVGLSIGAAVGLIFGAKYPERVEHVVIVGTRATSNVESNANHSTRIKYGYKNGPLALGRQSIARWFDHDWTAANLNGIVWAEKTYCKQSIQGYEASIAALRQLNLFPYAKDVGSRGDGHRFIFIAGEFDGTVPEESKELAEIMESQVIVIPMSGHITPIQMPETFHDAVRRAIS